MKPWTKKKIQERRQHWMSYWKTKKGCECCGYDKFSRALSFDHIDPDQKNPLVKNGGAKTRGGGMWQLTFANVPLRVLLDEMKKCRVLCMNCHMEDRHGYK